MRTLMDPNDLIGPISAHAADAVIVVDENQTIVAANPAAETIFGWAPEDLVGAPLSQLLPARARAAHGAQVRAFMDGGVPARLMGERSEVAGLRRDGVEFPAEASILRLETADGERYYAAIVRDITRRKLQARLLEESEQRFRSLFDLSYQFVALLSPAGTVLEVNRSALEFVARKAEEIRGLHLVDGPWFEACPESRARVRESIQRAAGGDFTRGRIVIRDHAGRFHTFDYSIKPVVADSGEVQSLIAEGRDISELADAHAALQRSEKHLRNAQRIARIGNWVWNVETGSIEWSDEIYRIFGCDPDGFVPSYEAFLAMVHPEDRQSVRTAVGQALEGRSSYAIDHRILRPDGSVRTVHEQGEVIRDDDGRPIVMEGVVQDVTEARAAEAALVEARRRAEAASEAKSRFLATVSHELRTPLNAIIGFSDILAGEMYGPLGCGRYREYAEDIRMSGQHLFGIIQSILDVSRIERGSLELKEDWIALPAFLRSLARLFEPEAETDAAAVHIVIRSDCEALFADERLLRQMLINLLDNSRKFGGRDGPIELSLHDRADGIAIEVRDYGPGMDEEALTRVTEPFVQLDNRLERSHEGIGLGLYLVRSFAEMHDGRLELESPPGGGMRARLVFPERRLGRAAVETRPRAGGNGLRAAKG